MEIMEKIIKINGFYSYPSGVENLRNALLSSLIEKSTNYLILST